MRKRREQGEVQGASSEEVRRMQVPFFSSSTPTSKVGSPRRNFAFITACGDGMVKIFDGCAPAGRLVHDGYGQQ